MFVFSLLLILVALYYFVRVVFVLLRGPSHFDSVEAWLRWCRPRIWLAVLLFIVLLLYGDEFLSSFQQKRAEC